MDRTVSAVFAAVAAVVLGVLIYHRNVTVGVSPTTTDGAALYQEACAVCHGAQGQGGPYRFPPLRGRRIPVEVVRRNVRFGRRRMPPHPNIRGEALENLAKYVSRLK